jgi:hypothetical protein
MKKNKIAMISVTFVLGVVLGMSFITLLSFVSPDPPSPNPALNSIYTPEANQLFHNYYDKAVSINDKLKGFYVDKNQLEAMNELAKNTTLTGFRIYLGKNTMGDTLGIVVGVTNKLLDDLAGATVTKGLIYKTESKKSGPCPFVCDVSSAITK